MKRLCFCFFLLPCLLISFAEAHEISRISFEISDPPKLILSPDLRQTVSGISRTFAQGECQGDRISEIFQEADNLSTQAERLRSFFERCGNDISSPFDRNSMLPLIKFSAIRYVLTENPHIKMATITMPSGRVVRGFLALKPDNQARPFILVKCGLFCDAKESSNVVSALMHLFDESPFNVLVLGNISGAQFERENKSFAVGGFDEGRQLYQIASYLKEESQIKDRISSVQVLGVSLGGHAALYSALYSSQNILPSNGKAIDAAMAVCPVVNLENSLRRLYNHDLLSHGYALVTFRTLMSFADRLPFLGEALRQINKKNPYEFYDLLTTSSLQYYENWTRERPWDLQPFFGTRIYEQQQFWRLNNFAAHVYQVIIPTLVIVAANDDIVRYSDNAELIPHDHPLVQVLSIPHGGHCGFSVANGYERWSRLLQDYFISNDPTWKHRRRSVMVDLSPQLYERGFFKNFRPPIFSEQVQAEWSIQLHRPDALLTLRYFNPLAGEGGASCLGIPAADADDSVEARVCLGQVRIKVPLQKILAPLNESLPQTSFAAERLTRLLNTRTTLVDENFENYLRSATQRPVYLKIEGFK